MGDTEHRIGCRMWRWDTGCGMGCRMGDAGWGCEIWDGGFRIGDVGVRYGKGDAGWGMQNHPSPGERLGKRLQAQQDEQGRVKSCQIAPSGARQIAISGSRNVLLVSKKLQVS